MGIHFAHTQSEELHFLNPVSQQQRGAVAMWCTCKWFRSWDDVAVLYKKKGWCLCLCQPHCWTNGGPAPPYSICFVMQINSNTGVIGAEARCWAENTWQLWRSFVGPSQQSRRSYLMQMLSPQLSVALVSPSFYVICGSIFQLKLLYS